MMWIKVIQNLILHTWIYFEQLLEFCLILFNLKKNPQLFIWENATVLSSSHIFCAVSLADWNLALASLVDWNVMSFTSLQLNVSSYLLINILTFLIARLFSTFSLSLPHSSSTLLSHASTYSQTKITYTHTYTNACTHMAYMCAMQVCSSLTLSSPLESSSFVILLFFPLFLLPPFCLCGDGWDQHFLSNCLAQHTDLSVVCFLPLDLARKGVFKV